MAPGLVIIADDLTGAADSGAASADAGLVTVIPMRPTSLPTVDVLAINTDTRDLPRDLVAARIETAVHLARSNGPPDRWYKKLDSALRGHPGLELATIMSATGFDRAVLCLALPSQGRTTAAGRVLIDGTSLQDTPLGQTRNTSSIGSILAEETSLPIHLVPDHLLARGPREVAEAIAACGPGITIIDATSEADLDTIVAAVGDRSDLLLAGSAGLAGALVRNGTIPHRAPAAAPVSQREGPILVVSGTRHDATARQIEVAERVGFAVVRPDTVTNWTSADREALIERTVVALSSGRNTVLTITGCPVSIMDGGDIATQLAAIATARTDHGQRRRAGSNGWRYCAGGL